MGGIYLFYNTSNKDINTSQIDKMSNFSYRQLTDIVESFGEGPLYGNLVYSPLVKSKWYKL